MENCFEAAAARNSDAEDDGGADEGGDERPRKRRRGGEIGRDWQCEVEGCTKDFKSVGPFVFRCDINAHYIIDISEKGFEDPPYNNTPRPT